MLQKMKLASLQRLFTSKYVLYSKLRPYLNKVVVPDDDGYATTELIPLFAESTIADTTIPRSAASRRRILSLYILAGIGN